MIERVAVDKVIVVTCSGLKQLVNDMKTTGMWDKAKYANGVADIRSSLVIGDGCVLKIEDDELLKLGTGGVPTPTTVAFSVAYDSQVVLSSTKPATEE